MALPTVSLWLKRIGLGKRSRLAPPEPPNRYELSRPGELVHVDVKKLARISARGAGHRVTGHRRSQFKRGEGGERRGATGCEFVHVMVDDHSRLAYAEVFQGKAENARQAVAFLRRGIAFFAEHGVQVKRVMSDNGSGYVSHAHGIACRMLGIRHLRTRPYRPPTNGKESNASSARSCANGPTRASTAAQKSASASYRSSSSATTTDDHTAPSESNRPRHD